MKVEIELSEEDEFFLLYYGYNRFFEDHVWLMGDYSRIIHDIVQNYLKRFYGN